MDPCSKKRNQPADIEGRIYSQWEEADAFAAGRPERVAAGADPYCIVIPPPNVTGSLHIGHALNNTLQDVLVRFERMRGRDVLWQPGMDHAGIATQMVVERQLMEKQEPNRHDMGREAFVDRVWEWKNESGGIILHQLRRLGASCDWSRERFTMDDGLSEAVLKVFVELYREGLIYKDKRLVNWDPKLLTAISDLEVQQVETNGHLWHFNYPIKDDPDRVITVATTRPETMLGDTGVAVHPEDERYKDLVGKTAILPLVGREIRIVADEYADPEAGSGAVKITPAHDFNDFEVGKRHDLPMVNVFDTAANVVLRENAEFVEGVVPSDMLDKTIADLDGLDRFAARKRIVDMMEEAGRLSTIEDHVHMVPHGDRGGVPIEPYLTEQWYVDAATLAKPAIEAVEEGKTVFVPKNWEKTYFEWMRNIQPWCVSRQLWWGHQIPAWYGPDGEVFVAHDEAEASNLAREHYGSETELTRDPDVLDTWFSSALWPFSTLGWPEETDALKRYYKTDVLVTAFDIIFFWVARMMMMGLHFRQEVPFHTVYIHALVRDEKGQKMSKSKGNIIDPLELVDEFGADALRFTLTAMAAQGRDIKLAKKRVEGYRNFGTKIWNAARFLEMNECVSDPEFAPAELDHTVNRWIVGEAEKTARLVTEAIEAYRFNDAAGALYHYLWHVFCDWYVELAKPLLQGGDQSACDETRKTAAWAFDEALKMLHPVMPFLTEELWQHLGQSAGGRQSQLILSDWPNYAGLENQAAADEIDWVIAFVSNVRSVRSEMNVPAGAKIPVAVTGAGSEIQARIERHGETIKRLARIETITLADEPPQGSVQIVHGETTIALLLKDVIDIGAETERLTREIAKMDGEISKLDAKLSNANFVSRAPEHVVAEQRERKADAEATVDRLKDALRRLEQVA